MGRPSFEVLISGSGSTQQDYPNPGAIVTATVPSRHAKESTEGVTRRKPEGWIPPTNYSFDRFVGTADVGRVQYEQFFNGVLSARRWFEGTLGSDSNVGYYNRWLHDWLPETEFLVPDAWLDKTLTKARLAMKRGDLNLGVAFAERSRTAQLVADTSMQLVRSVRALRKGDWRRASKELGLTNPKKPRGSTIPQKWLELQYGWKPLLSDVYGSAEALAQLPRKDWIVTSKSTYKEEINKLVELRDSVCWVDSTVRGWRGASCRIDAIPQNDLLLSLSSLGVTNPALIGWELVPFSFVADWFLPIGSWLESLDAMLGYGESWCSQTRFSRAVSVARPVQGITPVNGFGVNYVHSGSSAVRRDERVLLRRSSTEGVPLPVLPRLRDGRSLNRMASALSLLTQVFSGKAR